MVFQVGFDTENGILPCLRYPDQIEARFSRQDRKQARAEQASPERLQCITLRSDLGPQVAPRPGGVALSSRLMVSCSICLAPAPVMVAETKKVGGRQINRNKIFKRLMPSRSFLFEQSFRDSKRDKDANDLAEDEKGGIHRLDPGKGVGEYPRDGHRRVGEAG